MKLIYIFFVLLILSLVFCGVYGTSCSQRTYEICPDHPPVFTLVFQSENNGDVTIESLDMSILKIENLLFDMWDRGTTEEDNLDPSEISKRISGKLSDNKLETYLNILSDMGYRLDAFKQFNGSYVATFGRYKRTDLWYWLIYKYSVQLLKTFDRKIPKFIFRSLGEEGGLYVINETLEYK